MTVSAIPHTDLFRAAGRAGSRLATSLVKASDVQYRRPPRPSSRGADPTKSVGIVNDPTGDTAIDERRLAVRAAVIEGELLLERFTRAAEAQAARVEEAADAWGA